MTDIPKACFGEASEQEIDWRSVVIEDDEDDDEILEETPAHVVEMLGFDPLDVDVDDGFNPDQPREPAGSPDGGQWAKEPSLAAKISARGKEKFGPGLYVGTTNSTRGKKASMRHEVWASNWAEAVDLMIERHREEHKLMKLDTIDPMGVQFIGEKKEPVPPPMKPPNKGSKEDLWREEMQKRYDQLGYKGD